MRSFSKAASRASATSPMTESFKSSSFGMMENVAPPSSSEEPDSCRTNTSAYAASSEDETPASCNSKPQASTTSYPAPKKDSFDSSHPTSSKASARASHRKSSTSSAMKPSPYSTSFPNASAKSLASALDEAKPSSKHGENTKPYAASWSFSNRTALAPPSPTASIDTTATCRYRSSKPTPIASPATSEALVSSPRTKSHNKPALAKRTRDALPLPSNTPSMKPA